MLRPWFTCTGRYLVKFTASLIDNPCVCAIFFHLLSPPGRKLVSPYVAPAARASIYSVTDPITLLTV